MIPIFWPLGLLRPLGRWLTLSPRYRSGSRLLRYPRPCRDIARRLPTCAADIILGHLACYYSPCYEFWFSSPPLIFSNFS